MSAIITEDFRRRLALLMLGDVTDSGDYYIGIGKSDKWADNEDAGGFSVEDPVGTRADALEVSANISSLITVSDSALVIPNNVWASGTSYQQYNPYSDECWYNVGATQPCYISNGASIFLCLKAGAGASTVAPTLTSFGTVQTADGYVWAYVQAIDNNISNKFNSSQFVSINEAKITDSGDISDCATATGGLVFGFTVKSGGSGYVTGNTSAVLRAAGAGVNSTYSLPLTLTIAGGVITGCSFQTSLALIDWPKGLLEASVEITTTSGTGALVIPHLAPIEGIGFNPRITLPSWFVGVAAVADDDISGDGVYSPYRQISLVKDPSWNSGTTATETLRGLKYIDFSLANDPSVGFSVGALIVDTSNKPLAFADAIETLPSAAGFRVYYHQNYISGFREIPATVRIGNTTNRTVAALGDSEYIQGSGEIVFTENRNRINRAAAQSEEIKLIIQL